MAAPTDFPKLIESVENLVFEVASWAFFVPKTLARATVKPRWIAGYVAAEALKKREERYQDYVAPIVCWLIAGVLPYAILLNRFFARLATAEVASAEKVFCAVAGSLAALPLVATMVIAVVVNGPVDRSRLRQMFETQCLGFTPWLVSLLPLFVVSTVFQDAGDLASRAACAPGTLALLVIITVEAEVMERELGWKGDRAWMAACGVGVFGFLLPMFAVIASAPDWIKAVSTSLPK